MGDKGFFQSALGEIPGQPWPPCVREAVSEADWRAVVPVGSFLENGTKAQSLSHGCAVPAPFTQGSHRVSGQPSPGCPVSLGLPAREAVTEGDWRVGVPVGLFSKAGTEAQPLSHGFAVPAPLAGEPRVSGKP